MSCKSAGQFKTTTVKDPLAKYNFDGNLSDIKVMKGQDNTLIKYDGQIRLISTSYLNLEDVEDIESSRDMIKAIKEIDPNYIEPINPIYEVLNVVTTYSPAVFEEAANLAGLAVKKVGSMFLFIGSNSPLLKGWAITSKLNVDFVDFIDDTIDYFKSGSSKPKPTDFKQAEKEKDPADETVALDKKIQKEEEEDAKISITTTDWTVGNDASKQILKVRPKMGLVRPYFQLIYFDEEKKRDIDISWYFRPISISWSDEQTDRVNTFTITCAYRPEFMELTSGCEIVPLIGTHEGKMLSLGSFFLKKVRVSMNSGSLVADILFTAINFANPEANTTYKSDDLANNRVGTYKSFLSAAAERFGMKLVVDKNVTALDKPPLNLPQEQKMTFLMLLSKICKDNALNFFIRKKQIIIQSQAYSKVTYQYEVNLSVATSFEMERDPSSKVKEVHVYMFNPTLHYGKKVKQKKEDFMVKVERVKKPNRSGRTEDNEGGIHVSIRNDIKTKSEAEHHGRMLLSKLNSGEYKGSITIPNCILFCGHDITVIQDVKGFRIQPYPVSFHIKRVNTTIGVNGWSCELELVNLDVGNREEEIAKLGAVTTILGEWRAVVKRFKSITHDPQAIMKFVEDYKVLRQNSGSTEKITLKDFRETFIAKRVYIDPRYKKVDNIMAAALRDLYDRWKDVETRLKKVAKTTLIELGEHTWRFHRKNAFETMDKVVTQNRQVLES